MLALCGLETDTPIDTSLCYCTKTRAWASSRPHVGVRSCHMEQIKSRVLGGDGDPHLSADRC
jgi:hypothetical protein